MADHNHATSSPKLPAWRRRLDALIGPGATTTEIALQFIPPILFCLHVLISSPLNGLHKPIASFLAFDLLGGVITNSTTAAKRWYHRADSTKFGHLSFVAPHVIHIALVAGLFRGMDMFFFASATAYLAIASVVIVNADRYIQKPVAMILYCGTVLMDVYVWKPTPDIGWFVPLFFLKLLISHLLPS